jgi:uncharacterized membrane protein
MKFPSIVVYVAVAVTILVADALWLGWIAAPMYKSLRFALNPGVSVLHLPYRMIPAILAYAAMVISLTVLAVPRVADVKGPMIDKMLSALFWGGMWGLGVYGTYDATNLAIIKRFPVDTALIDAGWGILLGSIGAFVGAYVHSL